MYQHPAIKSISSRFKRIPTWTPADSATDIFVIVLAVTTVSHSGKMHGISHMVQVQFPTPPSFKDIPLFADGYIRKTVADKGSYQDAVTYAQDLQLQIGAKDILHVGTVSTRG